MAISTRQFGVKNTNANITALGYTNQGILLIQDNASTQNALGGAPVVEGMTSWHVGPDENRTGMEYTICYTKYVEGGFVTFNTEGTINTEGYVPGMVAGEYLYNGSAVKLSFKMCTAVNFKAIAEELTGQSFADAPAAATWLNANNCWTDHPGGGSNNEEPSAVYWTITGCGTNQVGVVKYTGSDEQGVLVPGGIINTEMLIAPEKFTPTGSIIVGEQTDVDAYDRAALAWDLADSNLQFGICEL